MVRLIPDTEPAPTISTESESRDRWVVVDGRSEEFAREPRTLDEPAATSAPTLTASMDNGDAHWSERPAPTIVTTRRSKDGLLVGRQLPEGEGENVGGWGYDRPATTTTTTDPRVFQPGGHHEKGEQSHNAVRVTTQEAAVLQSFPPDYPWQGSRTAVFTQIGNAVPPLMARAVIAALLAAGNPRAEEREVMSPRKERGSFTGA